VTVLVLATRNPGKLRELMPLVAARGWGIETLEEAGLPETVDEETLEVHATFADNALAKARHFAARCGRVVLADDSGLEVTALGGAPGVRSKRWSGQTGLSGLALDAANNRHLLEQLETIGAMEPEARRARFVCAAAAVWPQGALVAEGAVTGRILRAPQGAGGFGYDPLFWCDALGATFGTVSREAKAGVSHRGQAFRGLLDRLGSALA
jgi:XTP/dITP diphosphohydrolase